AAEGCDAFFLTHRHRSLRQLLQKFALAMNYRQFSAYPYPSNKRISAYCLPLVPSRPAFPHMAQLLLYPQQGCAMTRHSKNNE
ncbi:hypothetical protein, partial [Pseudomonas folii]|uniref:hypothetical protein n=1 Tax=Pseudomonas folii TaxID=2762593 RepID=UPI001BE434CC